MTTGMRGTSQARPIEMSLDSFVETYGGGGGGGRLKLPASASPAKALQRTRNSIVRALSPYRGRANSAIVTMNGPAGISPNHHHHQAKPTSEPGRKGSRDENQQQQRVIKSQTSSEAVGLPPGGAAEEEEQLPQASAPRRSRSRKISLGGRLGSAVQQVVMSTKQRTSRAVNRRSVALDLTPQETDELMRTAERSRDHRTATDGSGEPATAKRDDENDDVQVMTSPEIRIERSLSTRKSDSAGGGGDEKTDDYGRRFATSCSAAHRGYLDRRIKRKQWERYWCVLYDSCLYCYNTPLSDVARHKTMLRGYSVVADVRNLNKTRFTFRLERKDVPSLHFSSVNHQDFLLWVGILEKETSTVQRTLTNGFSNRRCSDNISDRTDGESESSRSSRIRHRNSSPASLIARSVMSASTSSSDKHSTGVTWPCSSSSMTGGENEVWKHKFALLEEIFDQKSELVREKMMLERHGSSDTPPSSSSSSSSAPPLNTSPASSTTSSSTGGVRMRHQSGIQRSISREAIISQYENAKTKQDALMAKRLAFLNRRRNSTQLKLDHCIKELAPRGGKRRVDDPVHFSAMENRQKELRSALSKLDGELNHGEAEMRCDLVKLQQKRDLELMILEHTEMCGIIHRRYFSDQARHQDTWRHKYVVQRRRASNDAAAASSPRRRPLSAVTPCAGRASVGGGDQQLVSILENHRSSVFEPMTSSSAAQSNSSSASDLSELKSPEFWKRHFAPGAGAGGGEESGAVAERRHSSDTTGNQSSASDADSGFQHHPFDHVTEDPAAEVSNTATASFGPVPSVTVTVDDVEVDDEEGKEGGEKIEAAKARRKSEWMEKIDPETLQIIEDFESFASMKLNQASR